MTCMLFDANYFLALILPLDIWTEIVEESLKEVDELFNKKKIELVICNKVTDEIAIIINDLGNLLNKTFAQLKSILKNKDKPFTEKSIDKLRLEMDKLIDKESDLKKKNQLFHLESLILNEIKKDKKKTKSDILLECALFVNNFNFQLIGEIANYITKYQMKSIDIPKTNKKNWRQIETTVRNSIKNPSDAEILTKFIYYLEEKQCKGYFVTHDFKDFLVNSVALEGVYPSLKIIRPAYITLYLEKF